MIKRKVRIYPIEVETLRGIVCNAEKICSYWGHSDTREIAEEILGVKIPENDIRKPLALSENEYPLWNGMEFRKCYILSPNYKNSFRPALNGGASVDEIISWKALVVEWE